MISFVTGKILEKSKDSLTVLTATGLGYEINMPVAQVEKYHIGKEVSFYTYLKISENGQALYGFDTLEEKIFFSQLLSVSGVGPKSAMNILNLGSIEDIISAIAREDVKYLTAVQGLGQKTAERLVVELKSKVKSQKSKVNEVESAVLIDIIDGLVVMGYGKEEAKLVAKDLDIKDKSVEELLKIALQNIGK